MYLCGTLGQTLDKDKHGPFQVNRIFLSVTKNSSKLSIISPQIAFQYSLEISPPYFAESFGDIKESPTNLEHITKTLKIPWLIIKSLLMQKYPGLNPDRFEKSTLFLQTK